MPLGERRSGRSRSRRARPSSCEFLDRISGRTTCGNRPTARHGRGEKRLNLRVATRRACTPSTRPRSATPSPTTPWMPTVLGDSSTTSEDVTCWRFEDRPRIVTGRASGIEFGYRPHAPAERHVRQRRRRRWRRRRTWSKRSAAWTAAVPPRCSSRPTYRMTLKSGCPGRVDDGAVPSPIEGLRQLRRNGHRKALTDGNHPFYAQWDRVIVRSNSPAPLLVIRTSVPNGLGRRFGPGGSCRCPRRQFSEFGTGRSAYGASTGRRRMSDDQGDGPRVGGIRQ